MKIRTKTTLLLVFLGGAGCAGRGPTAQSVAVAQASVAPLVQPPPEPLAPPTSLEADRVYDSQLGLDRGGQFETFRQITELKRAVLLYQQFLERAEGRPELLPAVRKARERIADATETMSFLQPKPEPTGD